MSTQFQKACLALFAIVIGFSSCVNLKHVNELSSSSLVALQQFDGIAYSFKKHCQDTCELGKISRLNLKKDTCNCNRAAAKDAVDIKIYTAIQAYFEGLVKLSGEKVTDYKTDVLAKALKDGKFGSLEIDGSKVDAYSSLVSTMAGKLANGYRKRKIKGYIKEANEPIKKLIALLDLEMANLNGLLKLQKGELAVSFYMDIVGDKNISNAIKMQAIKAYHEQLAQMENWQNELLVYSKALKKISESHQKLCDGADHLSAADLKTQLTQYTGDLMDLISEYKKLNKQ